MTPDEMHEMARNMNSMSRRLLEVDVSRRPSNEELAGYESLREAAHSLFTAANFVLEG